MSNEFDKIYVRQKDIWGLPQRYKDVDFYPIKLKDVDGQRLFYHLFQYPKDCIPDKKIIKMSYLKYLLYVVQRAIDSSGTQITDNLLEFLKIITGEDVDIIESLSPNENKDILDRLILCVRIGGKEFSEQDFDMLRRIILEQNGLSLEYIESYNPELEEHLEFANKDIANATLEDQVFVLASVLREPIYNIQEYTLYQFKKHLKRMMLLMDYEIYSPLEVSGQIKAKNGRQIIKHYMLHLEPAGRYDSILISKEDFMDAHPDLNVQENGVPNR